MPPGSPLKRCRGHIARLTFASKTLLQGVAVKTGAGTGAIVGGGPAPTSVPVEVQPRPIVAAEKAILILSIPRIRREFQ